MPLEECKMEVPPIAQTNGNNKTALRLNIGCGLRKIDGFIGVDKRRLDTVDVVHDLETYPWPFEENSIKEAVLVHVMEHFNDPVGIMTELYRVMEPNGKVGIEGPYWTSVGSWQDPDHKHALSQEFFHYFNKEFRESQKIDYIPKQVDFFIENIAYSLHKDYLDLLDNKKITQEELDFAIKHNVNVVGSFGVILRCIKEPRKE